MKFIVQFAQTHVNFRLSELESCCSIFNIKLKLCSEYSLGSPFLLIDVSEECVHLLLSRCVLIKNVFKYITHALDIDTIISTVKEIDLQEYNNESLYGNLVILHNKYRKVLLKDEDPQISKSLMRFYEKEEKKFLAREKEIKLANNWN